MSKMSLKQYVQCMDDQIEYVAEAQTGYEHDERMHALRELGRAFMGDHTSAAVSYMDQIKALDAAGPPEETEQ